MCDPVIAGSLCNGSASLEPPALLGLGTGSGASRGLSPRAPPGKPSGDRSAMFKLDEWRDISFGLRKLLIEGHEEAARIVPETSCRSEVVEELVMHLEASVFSAFSRLLLLYCFGAFGASVSHEQEKRVCKRIRLQLRELPVPLSAHG